MIPIVRWDKATQKARKDYQRCPSSFQLHKFVFNDPYEQEKYSKVSICGPHYRQLIEDIDITLKTLRRKAEQKAGDLKKEIARASKNDVFVDIKTRRAVIDQLWLRIKVIKKHQCRNPLCAKSVGSRNEKIFSSTIYSPRGYQKDQMYFCSNRCYSIIKEKCGIRSKVPQDQETIDMSF